jgi:hypothetical protein
MDERPSLKDVMDILRMGEPDKPLAPLAQIREVADEDEDPSLVEASPFPPDEVADRLTWKLDDDPWWKPDGASVTSSQTKSLLHVGLWPETSPPERNQHRVVVQPPASPLERERPSASFASRVTGRRVDLIELIEDGIPSNDYLPASDGMFVRGKRHLIAAPKKTGKSLGLLVHLTQMVIAGSRIVIFDRENGRNLYGGRLEEIARTLGHDHEKIRERVSYYEFPQFRAGDGDELVALCEGADLVVFDAQRMFLTDLGLVEDSSDDYAQFCAIVIDPLFRAGIATVILDNTGHAEVRRSRGASAKGDLNEVLFTLATVERFNSVTTGLIELEVTDSRFGNFGRWEMIIGGGRFEPWRLVDTELPQDYVLKSTEELCRDWLAENINQSTGQVALGINVRKGDVVNALGRLKDRREADYESVQPPGGGRPSKVWNLSQTGKGVLFPDSDAENRDSTQTLYSSATTEFSSVPTLVIRDGNKTPGTRKFVPLPDQRSGEEQRNDIPPDVPARGESEEEQIAKRKRFDQTGDGWI